MITNNVTFTGLCISSHSETGASFSAMFIQIYTSLSHELFKWTDYLSTIECVTQGQRIPFQLFIDERTISTAR